MSKKDLENVDKHLKALSMWKNESESRKRKKHAYTNAISHTIHDDTLHDDTKITDRRADKTSQKIFSLYPSVPRCLRVDHSLDHAPLTAPTSSYQTSQVRRDASPSEDDRPGPSSSQPEHYTPDSTQREEEKCDWDCSPPAHD